MLLFCYIVAIILVKLMIRCSLYGPSCYCGVSLLERLMDHDLKRSFNLNFVKSTLSNQPSCYTSVSIFVICCPKKKDADL